MSENKRPKYTKEFKQDAIKLVVEQRYSCPEVGRRLGVAASNISRWVREYRQDQQDLSDNGITRKELEAENRRLKPSSTATAVPTILRVMKMMTLSTAARAAIL